MRRPVGLQGPLTTVKSLFVEVFTFSCCDDRSRDHTSEVGKLAVHADALSVELCAINVRIQISSTSFHLWQYTHPCLGQ